MKKLSLSIFVFLLSLSFVSLSQQSKHIGLLANHKSSKQNESVPKAQSKTSASYAPGRSVNYYWSQNINNWLVNDTTLFSYNYQGLKSEILSRKGLPFNKKQISYDSKGRIIEELNQSWNTFSNQWINSNRYVTVFDSKNNLIENRTDQFNSSNNQWEIYSGYRYVITYNSNNYMISNVYQYWNSSLSVWQDMSRTIYSAHTASGTPTLYEMQKKVGTIWENESRVTDIYSIFGELVEEMIELWDGSAYKKDERYTNVSWHKWTGDINTSALGSYTMQVWGSPNANQWNTRERHFSTYDSYGGRVATWQEYINTVWRNNSRDTYLYDVNFNATGFRQEMWIVSTNAWKIYSEQKITHFYAFGGTGQIAKTIWQQWNPTSMTFENDRKEEYSDYKLISGITAQTNQISSEISIFPNPFSSYCTLKFVNQVPSNEQVFSFQLYDVFGKLISQTSIYENETRIEKGDLSPGIYFYSVFDKTSNVGKGKLVVE